MPMSSGFVDFHCHLDLYPDHAAAVAECERDGVFALTVTTTPKAWPRNHELASSTRYVRAALGLHPQLVAERASEVVLWEKYLPQARYVGEVGLDAGPRFYKSLDLQKQVFEQVLRACAREGGKILTVHSVRAAAAVLDMVETHLPPTLGRVVLHWFTGSKAEARRALDLGCYFSVNTEMLRNERHRTLVASLPIERLLTETDGPFTQHQSRPARPRDVMSTVEALAHVRSARAGEVAAVIRDNLRTLVSSENNGRGM
jgi:TatD DNase family protein